MLRDLLLPRTDRLVLIEVVVVALVGVMLLATLRRHREWQLVVGGVILLVFGWFALRAVH